MAKYNMMIRELSFSYPNSDAKVLNNINLEITEGEMLLICGKNGSGKSTFLRQLKKEIIPVGKRTGEVFVGDRNILSRNEYSKESAFIFQNPDTQIVMEKVYNELTFSMENLGMSVDTMRKRVAEVVNFFGIEDLINKNTNELSGGEKQLVNLAAAIMLRPSILILDEPTSQLDPMNTRHFVNIIKRINEELAITIIIAEQNLNSFIDICSRVMVLDRGEVSKLGLPKKVTEEIMSGSDEKLKLFVPEISRMYAVICKKIHRDIIADEIPFNVRDFRKWAKSDEVAGSIANANFSSENLSGKEDTDFGKAVLNAKEIRFCYSGGDRDVLFDFNLSAGSGEIITLLGSNGSGKTTALKTMLGLLKPYRGKVMIDGTKEFMPQETALLFTCDTVHDELFGKHIIDNNEKKDEAARLVEIFNLNELLERHPYDISEGEQKKVALAIVLIKDANVIFLDEPTAGLDPIAKKSLSEILKFIKSRGKTIIIVSHDVVFASENSDRCALIFDGAISVIAETKTFFTDNYFYSTDVSMAAKGIIDGAACLEDIR